MLDYAESDVSERKENEGDYRSKSCNILGTTN